VNEVRIGVVGAGVMGNIHAENVTARVDGARLVAIADPDVERARECANRLRVVAAFTDDEEMFAAGGLDAIAICSPGDTHGSIIEAAAAAGLQIFCEKPLERDLAAARSALAAVEKAGVKLMVGFNRRYDPTVRAAVDAAHSGRIGTPLTMHIVARDPVWGSAKKPPGDLFLDTTIHDLDLAAWAIGDEVESVSAIGGVAGSGTDDPDWALTTLRFAGGAVVTVDNNRVSAHGYDQRLEILGTGGMVSTDNQRLHLASLSDAEEKHDPRPQPFFSERYATSYIEEMRAFVRCIRDGQAPEPHGRDGLRALVLAFAAIRSYEKGRRVDLEEITH
jgi:myo-inositol 2-dehydrogenase / D-chiro-inositol 1-dehydrogenase